MKRYSKDFILVARMDQGVLTVETSDDVICTSSGR